MPHKPRVFSAFWIAALFLISAGTAQAGEPTTLQTRDGVAVYATLTTARPDNDQIVLLFHQANGNREEYTPVVPDLTRLGYDTLAMDQRSGGDKFNGKNKTVARLGTSAAYLDAMPDLEAALSWAGEHDYTNIVTVGSSYSASLVILLAAQHPQDIDALASFSPGEYFDNKNRVKTAAAKIKVPFYITTDPDEADNVKDVLSKAHGDNISHYKPETGVHGASTLVKSRDPKGYKANLASFTRFMAGVADTRTRN